MVLNKNEIQILEWAKPEGHCAIVWPTDAQDELYQAGMTLESLGFLKSLQRSPERWQITETGRIALAHTNGDRGEP